MEPRDHNREMIDQLKQRHTHLVELITAARGPSERRDTAPPVSPAAVKPFTDGLP